MPARGAGLAELLERIAIDHGAGRIGGTCDQQAVDTPCPGQLFDLLCTGRPAGLRTCVDGDHFDAESRENLGVGRVSRHRQCNPRTMVECAQERQDKATRRACGHDDPVRRHVQSVGLCVVTRDPFTQGSNPQRLGVTDLPDIQSLARGFGNTPGRRSARLANLHVHDIAPRRLDPVGFAQHIHGQKRRHVAAR